MVFYKNIISNYDNQKLSSCFLIAPRDFNAAACDFSIFSGHMWLYDLGMECCGIWMEPRVRVRHKLARVTRIFRQNAS